jgi:hypothetical protein
MLNELLVLAGVIVGALASYLTTAATESARWRRTLDSRWDDRRVEAYASYAQAVKEVTRLVASFAAGRGIALRFDPLSPTQDNLDKLASASSKRATAWESVLLLGHRDAVISARKWHESVWHLDWVARLQENATPEDYETARVAVDRAREDFYESARLDLQVKGGALPNVEDFETRVRRIQGN